MKYTRICCGNTADPAILVENGKYYLTVSSFRSFPGLKIYESENLTEWKKINAAVFGNISDIWAPDICKIGDRYVIYFPDSSGNIYAVYTDNLYSQWSSPILLGSVGMIDPGFARDVKSGQNWLFFSGGYAVPLSKDGLSFAGEPKMVYEPWKIPDEWDVEGVCCEGPKLFYRDGYYYLTLAEGGTAGPATSHMAVMFRSECLTDGWEPSPYNPVLHTYSPKDRWWSVGHATPFEATDGSWKLIFHGYEKGHYNEGRQILICNAVWENGWLKAIDSENADIMPQDREYVFADTKVEKLWTDFSFFGSFDSNRLKITRNGLELNGMGESVRDSCPLLINETAGDFEILAQFVDIENQGEFGLTFFYNENCNAGICLKNSYVNTFCLGGYRGYKKISSDVLYLKIIKHDDVLTYYFSEDGLRFTKTETSDEVSGFHHNVFKGFLSLSPGIYATGGCTAKCKKLILKFI